MTPWREDFLDWMIARGIKPTSYQSVITLAFDPRAASTTQISKLGRRRVGATALLLMVAIEAVEEHDVDVVHFAQGNADPTAPDPLRRELAKWSRDLATLKRIRRVNTTLVSASEAAAEVTPRRDLVLIDDANLLNPETFSAIQVAAAAAAEITALISVP